MTTILIDGNNQTFVSNMAMSLSNRGGFPTQAIHGFFKSASGYKEDFGATQMIVAWDGEHSPERKRIFPEYKANRKAKKANPEMEIKLAEMRQQIPVIAEICSCLGWTQIVGGEADDSIAMTANMLSDKGKDVVIVSSDKDFYQLVGAHVSIMNPMSIAEVRHITADNFEAVKGMKPEQWLGYRAMMGDKSDNIPGAAGVGEGTAKKIIEKFGTPENFKDAVESGRHVPSRFEKNLIKGWQGYELSKCLMDLKTDGILTGRLVYAEIIYGRKDGGKLAEIVKNFELAEVGKLLGAAK